jgi:hypothetical protein
LIDIDGLYTSSASLGFYRKYYLSAS